AALPQRAVRQAVVLQARRQVGGVLGEEFGRALVAPHVDLLDLEAGSPHEYARTQVVDAWPEDAESVCSHSILRLVRASMASAKWTGAMLYSSRSRRILWASASTSACVKPCGGSKRYEASSISNPSGSSK